MKKTIAKLALLVFCIAAMVYIFDALSHNRLLKAGDQIAIGTPIFTPYMQIPSAKNYGLVSIDVTSSEEENWDIAETELAKLEDPSVKAFFLRRQATGICNRGRSRFRSDAAAQRLCHRLAARHSPSAGVFKARELQTPCRRHWAVHLCRRNKPGYFAELIDTVQPR